MALMFYFLPTLYSAYRFGRRHAMLTALASVILVCVLTYLNPTIFTRQVNLPIDSRWFDVTAWGGILVVAGYAMGTLYERNEESMLELKAGYDGMLAILQQFITNQKYSEAHSYRIATYSTKIAESLGLDAGSTEDVRTAALLRNVNEMGISNEILYKAANLSQEDLQRGMRRSRNATDKARTIAGTLGRAIPILVAGQELMKSGASTVNAALEVQILVMAENYEALVGDSGGRKLSPVQAQEIIVKSSKKKYDSMVVDAFVRAFAQQAAGAKA
jgi:HD-GYP domain-containing protein (c-di-GMP phosphodiesterase class II)